MIVDSIAINGEITTIKLIGSVSDAELDGLKTKYGEVWEHMIVLYKVRPTDAEVAALRAELGALKKTMSEETKPYIKEV